PRPGTGGCRETVPTFAAFMSCAVSTASTFFALRASSVFTATIRACVCGERTKAAWAELERRGSSMKWPAPRTRPLSLTGGVWLVRGVVVMQIPDLDGQDPCL